MRFRNFRLPAMLTAAMLLAGCASQPQARPAPASAAPSPAYNASVVRTGYGVPHITAQDWGSLGYGYGYVIAQDNLCTLSDAFVTMRGDRSRYFGPQGKAPHISTLEAANNLDSDFFFRFVIDDAVVAGYRAAQSPEFDRLVAGYADGYSRYVQEIRAGQHPGRHADCRSAEWLGEIDGSDLYRRFYTIMLALSETRMMSAIANAAPPKPGAPVAQVGRFDADALAPRPDPTQLGSNAIAFGANATGSPHGLLFGNPHWMWIGMDRFYQVHLRIPGTVDVQGASIMGVPLVLIGFNHDIAWSHTVSTAQRYSFYRLALAEGDPTAYVYDGQVRKMQPVVVRVPVRGEGGAVETVERTLYRSHFGPVLAKDWTAQQAIAVRAVNVDNLRSFRNWMRWSQADSLEAFIRIQREEVAIPWVNTIAAGRNDPRAWYADIGAIPHITDAQEQACGVAPRTLDGSRSACEWGSDADAVQPGTFGPARLPSLATRDYVANMNDSFWLANADQPLTGYPRIIGATDSEQSFRTRMGLTLIRQRLDGSDGLGGTRATSEHVRDFVVNSRNMTAELFLPAVLKDVCSQPGAVVEGTRVDIAPACRALRAWDKRGNVDSSGAHLWDMFWAHLQKEVPEASRYRTPFDPADPVNTPRDLDTRQPGVAVALAKAVRQSAQLGLAPDAKVGSYQYLPDAQGGKVPLAGGCGETGYFAIACTRYEAKGTQVSPHGNSYMQVVGFDDAGPQAWTFLLSSQSTDPASPYFRAGTQAYSNKTWTPAVYREADIQAGAIERLTLQGSAQP